MCVSNIIFRYVKKIKFIFTYMSISSMSRVSREADIITPLSLDCIDCTDKWSSESDWLLLYPITSISSVKKDKKKIANWIIKNIWLNQFSSIYSCKFNVCNQHKNYAISYLRLLSVNALLFSLSNKII